MTNIDVGIVGAGISGATLALRLQQLGIDATLYSEQPLEALGTGRLVNTVARFGHTIDRERRLGVHHFDGLGHCLRGVHLAVTADPPLGFFGSMGCSVEAVDFRLLLPRLVEDFTRRGGRLVVIRPAPTPADIVAWSRGHDLMVVAVGRRSMGELFPPDPARSPFAAPLRRICSGLYTGVALPEPLGLSFNVSPGAGELFQMPIWTRTGLTSAIMIEAIPGGPLEAATLVSYRDNAQRYLEVVTRLLREHAPLVADRVDHSAFDLLGPDDVLQGAITPLVRRCWTELPGGGLAVAIGDAWITNDPITGQGANLGSHCAWVLAEAVSAGGSFDVDFARRLDAAMWRFAGPVTAWSNSFLLPPTPQLLSLLGTASQRPEIADAFIGLFNDPPAMWALLSDPDPLSRIEQSVTTRKPGQVVSGAEGFVDSGVDPRRRDSAAPEAALR